MGVMELWMGLNLLASNLMSKLEWVDTGNVWVDCVIFSLAPIVIHLVVPDTFNFSLGSLAFGILFAASVPLYREKGAGVQARLRASGISLFYKLRDRYETVIEFEKETKTWVDLYGQTDGDSEEGKRNNILQKAVVLYIGDLKLKYRRSQALLTAVNQNRVRRGRGDYGPQVFGGTAEQLRSFDINMAPPENVWVLVDEENGIWFKQHKSIVMIGGGSPEERGKTRTTVRYTFQCARKGGDAKIKEFLKAAYDWHTGEMAATEDNARYMYSLVATPEPKKKDGNKRGGGGYDEPGAPDGKQDPAAPAVIRYKRYELGDLKNFDSLFFPEKDNLLKILGNFEAKRGKYALPGYPHKLGLLLHGPPGTGKTSLIKALACRTKRHIIQVPLGRIKTNQDLMNIMFDQSFSVVKQELPVPLKHKDVIYVFEDVDAASKIVKSRKNMKTAGAPPPPPPAAAAAAGGGTAKGSKKAPGGGKGEAAAGDDDEKYGNEFDKLDLSGLLNVLDGVVDTPGRIVVVTTNVVDSLDPALIRPGRIDKKILLDYMEYEAALAMTKHFFPDEVADGDLADEHKRRLRAVFSAGSAARRARPTSKCGGGGADKGRLTPATVEQMLGEHDKVNDFLAALEDLAADKEGQRKGGRWSLRDGALLALAAVFVAVRVVQKVFR